MNTGAEFWGKHVTAAGLEAISASAYAKKHGISVTRLYYWLRKSKATPLERAQVSAASKFVALRVAETVITQRPSCTLVLASGMRLEMSALPAPQWLTALVRAEQGVL